MSTFADRVALEDDLLLMLEKSGCQRLIPEGLVTPRFPDTFAASAFHTQIVDAMTEQYCTPPQTGVEWVYRHVDADKVGVSPLHLSMFRMLVYFVAAPKDPWDSRREAVSRFIDLISTAGLDSHRLTVTYFGGGVVGGITLNPDDAFVAAWRDAGVSPNRLIAIPGSANFTNIRRPEEPAGPRCEIYYDHPTYPGAVEIGTVVSEQYLLAANGTLTETAVSVTGGAVGIERLEMCARSLSSIGETSALERLARLVLAESPRNAHPIIRGHAIRIANGIRAIFTAAVYLGRISTDRRSTRLRVLIRDVVRTAREAGIDLTPAFVQQICSAIEFHEAMQAPERDARIDSAFHMFCDVLASYASR